MSVETKNVKDLNAGDIIEQADGTTFIVKRTWPHKRVPKQVRWTVDVFGEDLVDGLRENTYDSTDMVKVRKS